MQWSIQNTGTAFTSRGMHVNDSVGNTEAFLNKYGTGAGKVRADANAGSQAITAMSPMFGQLDIGKTDQ